MLGILHTFPVYNILISDGDVVSDEMILSQGGKPADILMEVTVPVIKQMKCRKQTR